MTRDFYRLPDKVLRRREREEQLVHAIADLEEENRACRRVLKKKKHAQIAGVVLKRNLDMIKRLKAKRKRLGKVM